MAAQAQGLPATAIALRGAWSDIGQLGWWSASPARASAWKAATDENYTRSGAIAPQPHVYYRLCPGASGPVAEVAFVERSRFSKCCASSDSFEAANSRVERTSCHATKWPARLRRLVPSRSADSAAHRRPTTARRSMDLIRWARRAAHSDQTGADRLAPRTSSAPRCGLSGSRERLARRRSCCRAVVW